MTTRNATIIDNMFEDNPYETGGMMAEDRLISTLDHAARTVKTTII